MNERTIKNLGQGYPIVGDSQRRQDTNAKPIYTICTSVEELFDSMRTPE